MDDKNLAAGRCSLSNDEEFSNSELVSAFTAEFYRIWKTKAEEIKALEKRYIGGGNPVDTYSFL